MGCGNYGPSGSLPDFDFVHIPMASADGTAPLSMATSNFCGGGLVIGTAANAATMSVTMPINQITICSKYQKYNSLFIDINPWGHKIQPPYVWPKYTHQAPILSPY